MWELIVMGQIPGTQIQVTFSAWLFAMACLAMALIIYRTVHNALTETETTSMRTPKPITYSTLERRKVIPVTTRMVLSLRIGHAIQATALSRRLAGHRQVQA